LARKRAAADRYAGVDLGHDKGCSANGPHDEPGLAAIPGHPERWLGRSRAFQVFTYMVGRKTFPNWECFSSQVPGGPRSGDSCRLEGPSPGHAVLIALFTEGNEGNQGGPEEWLDPPESGLRSQNKAATRASSLPWLSLCKRPVSCPVRLVKPGATGRHNTSHTIRCEDHLHKL
jgi:hypothetical protein